MVLLEGISIYNYIANMNPDCDPKREELQGGGLAELNGLGGPQTELYFCVPLHDLAEGYVVSTNS